MALQSFLMPVIVLIAWTMALWVWMYTTRIPAMNAAAINPDDARHPGTYGHLLPSNVRAVADNYNHLHEQPTIFYALMFFAALSGGADQKALYLAWGYVALRVLHSLVQILVSKVVPRFIVFALGSMVLIAFTVKELVRVFF
jgi:hypothetical protein